MAPDLSMSTWTPNPLISSPFDTAVSKIVDLHFTSYDSIRSNTYTIIRSGFNPYYWSPSDSAFLQERINVSLNANDSLIYYKAVSNGNARGWEWMKHPRNSDMYQRIRVLLNGDQQYILYITALKDDILSPDANRFFDDFRFTQPVANTRLFIPNGPRGLLSRPEYAGYSRLNTVAGFCRAARNARNPTVSSASATAAAPASSNTQAFMDAR